MQRLAITMRSSRSKPTAWKQGEHSSRWLWICSRLSIGQLTVEELVETFDRFVAIGPVPAPHLSPPLALAVLRSLAYTSTISAVTSPRASA